MQNFSHNPRLLRRIQKVCRLRSGARGLRRRLRLSTSLHHFTGYWLLPVSVQEGCVSSTTEEERVGRQSDEELQTCF